MHALADCRALITGRFYFMTQQPVLTPEAKKCTYTLILSVL